MKRIVLYLFPLLFLTSCFEVVEELDLKRDDSGTFRYTINLSQSKLELNTALKLDTFMGVKIPSESYLRGQMTKANTLISGTEGIRKASYTADFDNYIFIYNIQFDSLKALDKALENTYYTMSNNKKNLFNDKFLMPKNILKRESNIDSLGLFKKMNSSKKGALKEATYTCVYRFEDKVKNVSNKNARTSPNGKAVMLRCNVKSLLNNEITLRNNITLIDP